MSQAPTDGMSLLDPFGIWKTARDANLEAWSKMMIDVVNSDEYSQATGLALEQMLATSQPLRDAIEKTMTQTLSMLNMPSRAEVISVAERLVNVEMRLDDLDAKLTTVQEALQETIKNTVHQAMSTQNARIKAIEAQVEPEAMQATIKEAVRGAFAAQSTRIRTAETDLETAIKDTVRAATTTQNSHLKDINIQLQAVHTMLADLQAPSRTGAQPKPEPKAEAKPAAKPEPKPEPKPAAKPEPKAEARAVVVVADLREGQAQKVADSINSSDGKPEGNGKADDKPAQPTAKKEQEAK